MDNAVQDYARSPTLRSPDHYRGGPFTVRHGPGRELQSADYAAPGRGVGATLSAWLTRTAFERGYGTVWPEPGAPGVERVHARIGYRRTGRKLTISLAP
ncbi:hypothetical protein [Streptomyces sp. NPDC014623]|uniref:hypothetical protein n=1 Tax=Streptomyces sp. NPDC014623 TaxID=3364875 RepID=UPI003701E9F8